MNLGNIINQYRIEHKMSMDKFADLSGLSKGYISMLEKNQHPKTGKSITPSLETFILVSNAMGINLNELILMLDDEQTIEIKRNENINLNKNFDEYFDKYDNVQPITTKKLPLLGEIACGEPMFAVEDRESYIEAFTF